MLRDNRDRKVRSAGINFKTGRKWLAQNALKESEARLRQNDIVGARTHGRLGLGSSLGRSGERLLTANEEKWCRRRLDGRRRRQGKRKQWAWKPKDAGCNGRVFAARRCHGVQCGDRATQAKVCNSLSTTHFLDSNALIPNHIDDCLGLLRTKIRFLVILSKNRNVDKTFKSWNQPWL